ncbi:PTS acetylglucosamine transporter subunit IIB [Dictyobacter alpinus]|uniref:PTS acetylglucosamine transporter subunit IIB n=1 Tax=Dictyobacter alpinus TaxID=2014873 RepID=A0A402BIC2_9CHLR|nr:PTS transporter subunit EIIC [Dictyobacter alpinus]GCE31080.1 PTS acetylglucosamine transporter subunit IIB [Dictyobacter alpinus]
MSSVSTSSTTTGDRVLGALQTVGRSLMLPIAVMPAAALLLRLGQPDMLGMIHWHFINWEIHLDWIAKAGDAIFSNLPLIFAIGIAIGLSGGEGTAALAALVGFLVFDAVFKNIIPQIKAADGTFSPDPNITMGVLSGILMGLVAARLYKRYHDIRLPDYLGFFGGRRFVPIVTSFAALILGLIFGIIWPPIGQVINAIGNGIVSLGPVGAGIYGFLNRLLIPTGLHHVLNSYFWFELGNFKGPGGVVVHGDLNRYFAGDPSAGNYMAGFFPMMMFGLPAACLAMIRHARFPKVAAGILISAAVASFLTGITEPIEFAFLFVAPVLFVVHAVLTGTALAVCYLLNIKIGFGFSAGLFDLLLNFNKSNTSNPWLLILVGLVYAVIYYFVFSFFITRFDLATPGRGEESTGLAADWILPESQRTPAATTQKSIEIDSTPAINEDKDTILAREVLRALGGKANIESLEGCITRLRIFITEPDKIDEPRLKALGSSGVIKKGKIVQVVMGTQSDRIASRINRLRKEETIEA